MAFPIEEQYILEAEKELNLVFPSSFKNKMMIENSLTKDFEKYLKETSK